MFINLKRLSIILFLGLIFLAACSLPASPTATQESPNILYTAAAQTVIAQLTEAASFQQPTVQPTSQPNGQPTEAPTQAVPTNTLPPATATNTPVPPTVAPTNPPAPTATKVPPTATPVPCYQAKFVKDVTIPDNTEIEAGLTFEKTWRIMNTGSCTWDSKYKLVLSRGDAMGADNQIDWDWGTVSPGESVDITISFVAPDEPDTYKGEWKIRSGSGQTFGVSGANNVAFWVQVVVVPSVTVDYHFVLHAKDAEWRNATQVVPWGDPGGDDLGVAALGDVKLENGKTYKQALGTYPERIDNGKISGLFSKVKIQSGEHFRALVGFKYGYAGGKVKLQLQYLENGKLTLLKEWSKSNDGKLLSLDYDLSSLKGHNVQIMLVVIADGSPKGDFLLWVTPRLER